MNISLATQTVKTIGYGKVFVRSNGEICMENKSGKVVLTLNADFSLKFQRHDMTEEVIAIKNALQTPTASIPTAERRWVSGDHTAPGRWVYGTGDYTKDVLSGFFQE